MFGRGSTLDMMRPDMRNPTKALKDEVDMKRPLLMLTVACIGLVVVYGCETNEVETLPRGYAAGIRCADRDALMPSLRYADMGVRCAKGVTAPEEADQVLVCGDTECPVVSGYMASCTKCPALPAYPPSCNEGSHCEYANSDSSGWRRWDVWIFVPAGEFEMGGRAVEGGPGNERPIHTVTFAEGFFIARYEAVVAQYEACMADGDCTGASGDDWNGDGWGVNSSAGGRSDHPQNGLTWDQARGFCEWLGGRLPTEAEWEYAAAGPTGRRYPWGSAPRPDCDMAVFNESKGEKGYGCDTGGTWPVGSLPSGMAWSGAEDMAGNVWEWVGDFWHKNYTGAPDNGSAWTAACDTPYRVRRGGGFRDEDGGEESYAGDFDAIPDACVVGDTGDALKATGEPCEVDDECFGGLCLLPEFLASFGLEYDVPGGACSKLPCLDDSECGEGGYCFDTTPFSGMPLSLCLPACEDYSDCRYSEGYVCYGDPQIGDIKACLPGDIVTAIRCDDTVCDDNEKANPDICVDGCGCGDGVCDEWDNPETCVKDCS